MEWTPITSILSLLLNFLPPEIWSFQAINLRQKKLPRITHTLKPHVRFGKYCLFIQSIALCLVQVKQLEFIMAMQQMSSAFASSSKSSSSVVSLKKYDVFLSFRGEDTRRNFTSHLYDALSRKKVETFIDDNELEKGDKISPTLIKAIEESHASIVIFSENYASSKWCLSELNKILECKKDQGQIVIPVFYNIDPSHVRKQNGSYKQAFAKHEQDLKLNKDKLQKWKAALIEAANLVGWDSQNYRVESDLIKDIVKDVLQKLNLTYPSEVKGLVGIEKNYEQIESLLKIGSNDVRILGIWGMGGIGKTTLAIALYAKMYSQFEGCYFLDVREESNKYGLNALRNKLFSTLLEEENLRPDAPYVEISFFMRMLGRKKVFIVLDGVATSDQIEHLIVNNNWLGFGSRVIVTTRDKHVFSQFEECEIYEVKELNFHDSLQLFCLIVFREKHPKIGYEDLSQNVIAYCKGNPLALKVSGANLRSRSKEAWKSELKKLQKIPNGKIHNVLKSSYDDLDRTQKDIFLDIACFLRGEPRDRVTSILEACDFFAASGIEVLLDKALIQLKQQTYGSGSLCGYRYIAPVTISSNDIIEMHDLIQEMGRQIVNQESKDPGKRSRLWKFEEVSDVLRNNKGTEVVEGITFDSHKFETLYLSPDSFKRMSNLRYLNVKMSNVYFPDGLGWLSDKLRCLDWPRLCLERLPSNFCAEKIVELRLPFSMLKKLWDGVQNLVNLKEILLNGSKDLIEVPNLSRASNLERVDLSNCESLCQLHPSILSLPKLTLLHLGGCKKIESLKTNIHSKSLCELYLYDCSSLVEFLVTSEKMTNLALDGTAIRELSSSIWRNSKLTFLDLSKCNKLNIVGNKLSNDPGLGSLAKLDLSGCTQINESNLWSILDGIQSLKQLDLTNCYNLEALPNNIQNLSMLEWLQLDDCRKLVSLPKLPPSLQVFRAVNCTSLDKDSTQWPVLNNMLQSMSYIPEHLPYEDDIGRILSAFFFLPGAQVPSMFGFHTTEASITIPLIPKSGLCGFIFCIILSEVLIVDNYSLLCFIYEDGKKVDVASTHREYFGTLIYDHVWLCWYGYNTHKSGGDHYNLSFEFKLFVDGNPAWLRERIKGCGVFPVYALTLDGSSSEEIIKLESNDQISDRVLKIDMDELQHKTIGGGVRGFNCENEDDQEQLLVPENKKRRS